MLIRSISGVRGLVATHLTPQVSEQYTRAFHTIIPPGAVIVGRDSRPSGDDLLEAVVTALGSLGREVIICGIVPTPTVQFLVEHSDAGGGIIITASHNPIEWNGFKFVRADGTFIRPGECEQLFKMVDRGAMPVKPPREGMVLPYENAVLKHTLHIMSMKCLDTAAIRKRAFKVVVDSVNGAGSEALPSLLENLGCSVVRINCAANGLFTRGAEPLPEHLGDLCATVIQEQAAVGFAVDPDADRLAVVSEQGRPLGEEYTLVLAAEGYLKTVADPGILVTNLSSSLALEVMAARYDCDVARSPVGEINVVEKMLAIGAQLGGEGNGGVILRLAHMGRDSLVGAALVLHRMAQTAEPLSSIHASLPQFEMVKDKISIESVDLEKVFPVLHVAFSDAKVITDDGVKFSWPDRWIHLRKSNTEPILRIYAEAPEKQEAKNLVEKVKTSIKDTNK